MEANQKPDQERNALDAWCSLLQAPIIAQRVFWAAVLCGAASPEGWSSVQRERDLVFKKLYGAQMGRTSFRGAAASLADRGLVRLQANDEGVCTLWVLAAPAFPGAPFLGPFSDVGKRRASSLIFKFLEEDQTCKALTPRYGIKNCADILRFADSAIGAGCAVSESEIAEAPENTEKTQEWSNLGPKGTYSTGRVLRSSSLPPGLEKIHQESKSSNPPPPGISGQEADVELQLRGGLACNSSRVHGTNFFVLESEICGDPGAQTVAASNSPLPPGTNEADNLHEVLLANPTGLHSNQDQNSNLEKPQVPLQVSEADPNVPHEVLQYNLPGIQVNVAKKNKKEKPKEIDEVSRDNNTESNNNQDNDEIKKKDELCEAKQWKSITDLARALVEFWRVRTGRPVAKCTDKRKQMVRDRINDGFKPSELFMAVAGLTRSQWHRDNGHDDFELALRTTERIEKCHGYWHRYAPIERLIAHYDRLGAPCPVRHDEVQAYRRQQAQAAELQERLERTIREREAEAESRRRESEYSEYVTNTLLMQLETEQPHQEEK